MNHSKSHGSINSRSVRASVHITIHFSSKLFYFLFFFIRNLISQTVLDLFLFLSGNEQEPQSGIYKYKIKDKKILSSWFIASFYINTHIIHAMFPKSVRKT